MFVEMFLPVSAVKGEYNDLVMFNMQLGLGIARCLEEMFGMLSTCTYVQLINRGITDHFSRLGRASLIVTLQLFTPNHCGLAFPFDPGSRLITMFLRVTRNSVFCVSSNDLDHDKLIMPTLWNSYIWVDNVLEHNLPGFLSYKSRVLSREEKLQGLLEALAAQYSEQFPNVQVNKDDVLLFAIFGVVHISKSTLSYLVFDSGAKLFMVPIPITTSYIYVWDREKSFETMALSNYPVKAEALQLQGCSIVSLILDLLTSRVGYCYVSGDVEPTVSSISFLVSTLLVVTVGLSGQHCIVYSIKVVVFLNNGRRIFYIGESNDMPARKSMDAKMVVPYITFETVGTDFLYVPWYTNLLPIPEDTLSTVFVFSTTLTICYMTLNLHKSTVVMSSVKDLDQPFTSDHQPLLWLGMQKGVSHVLHLG
ncbi:hypothetical protein MTR67_013630 [Solanum verrucosum]|uniref:Uncharacterized protein n=2 Tax=Solanum TaxID=4107 RepID=A0AAF0TNZ9_SOLVR|nr:hypothetical protein MTR67_013630 [Solanum verrucosum]